MNRFIAQLLLLVSFLTAMCRGEVEAQSATKKTSDSQFVMIDSFDTPSDKKYAPFRSVDTVISTLGYGIYYRKADAQLSLVPLSKTDKALRIQYQLPPFFSWGNWLSIRKEFNAPLSLSRYSGLEMEVKVETPSNASLRLTLSDVETLEDAQKHGSDELWWYDFPLATLANTTQEGIKLRAPFQAFYLSYGEGVRHNNRAKDFARIVAYEISLISEGGEQPKGVISVNSLRAYKD